MKKLTIKGSATLDNPKGILVTEKGAMRFALANMPKDLIKAGFTATISKGYYGNYWVIGYSK